MKKITQKQYEKEWREIQSSFDEKAAEYRNRIAALRVQIAQFEAGMADYEHLREKRLRGLQVRRFG